VTAVSRRMTDPAAHEAHDLPLADRIAATAIQDWLNAATATARAANGNPPLGDYERGIGQGIDRMRHLCLDNYWYTVVPEILGALRRAGLLPPPGGG